MKNNILSEIQQIKFLFDYKKGVVISEQQQGGVPSQKILYSDNFGNEFESGRFSWDPQKTTDVSEKIKKITDFIQGKNLKDFKIVIDSGESRVPNQPPFQRVGSLAEKRAEFLKQNLERTLLPTLPAGVTPVIEVTPPKIGETEWDKNKGRDHEDYKREQFVRASIQSTKEIPGTPPPPPPPQKTKYAISWTLDNRCDRIKYFPTFQDWDAMVKKLEENPRFTAAYKETRGVPASEAWMKMGYLTGDPTMFEGPFFNNCSQKFEPAMK